MVDQNHSFYIKSSLYQKLSLIAQAAFCLSTFYFWPKSLDINAVKYLFIVLVLAYFVVAFYNLKKLKISLSLYSDHCVKFPNDPAIYHQKVLWVSPLFCAFYVSANDELENNKVKKRLIVIWRDMLSETNYRHLSRLLLFNVTER